ncbi:MAG: hypothetical protein ACI3V0_11710 [Faecousia sp.]
MMVKCAFRKLNSRKGESLVESLAAILIFTMASIAMYSMVTTAADINLTVKDVEKDYNRQMLIAEQGEGTPTEDTITMTMTTASGSEVTLATVPVQVYGTGGELYSYFAVPPDAGGGS